MGVFVYFAGQLDTQERAHVPLTVSRRAQGDAPQTEIMGADAGLRSGRDLGGTLKQGRDNF